MKKFILYLNLSFALFNSAMSQVSEYKILPDDGNAGNQFGHSVSIFGDYAIVGAPFSNDSAGAAYVFEWDGSSWNESQTLTASDGIKGDEFGGGLLSTISLSGEYAIIGSPESDSSKGAAYIFKNTGTTWIEEQKLIASDRKNNDQFGISVSISGNIAVVGARNDDSTGSVYVFVREDTNWIEKNKIESDISDLSPGFGMAVSLSGDHLVVGAPNYGGSAFIYRRDGDDWIREQRLEPVGIDTAFSLFGISVSTSEDYILIGAPWSRTNGYMSGAAYVFRKENTSWTYEQKLLASDGVPMDYFGLSLSTSTEYLAIGAPNDDDGGTNSGSAYIFRKVGSNWNEQQKLTASDATDGESLGFSVSTSESKVILGALYDDDNGASSGSAYIFNGFIVGVENDISENPLSYSLGQNYPNPFNLSTTIRYTVPQSSNVVIKVYDILGNEIEILVNEAKPVGTYEITWSAEKLTSGIYFYQLQTDGFVETKKMILMK